MRNPSSVLSDLSSVSLARDAFATGLEMARAFCFRGFREGFLALPCYVTARRRSSKSNNNVEKKRKIKFRSYMGKGCNMEREREREKAFTQTNACQWMKNSCEAEISAVSCAPTISRLLIYWLRSLHKKSVSLCRCYDRGCATWLPTRKLILWLMDWGLRSDWAGESSRWAMFAIRLLSKCWTLRRED